MLIKSISPAVLLRKINCRLLSTIVSFKEKKIKIDEFNINYVKVGNGEHKVLLLPGTLGTIETEMLPQLEAFDKEKFTMIAWDPPGYGKSRPPEKKFNIDFYENDADVAYKFMEALEIPKYSLMGFSGGGLSSMILAGKYPHVLNKLVAWGVLSYILPRDMDMFIKLRDINNWSNKKKESLSKIYGEQGFIKIWWKWCDGMNAIFDQKNGDICINRLKDIKCPTFLLTGLKDPMADQSHLPFIESRIRGSRTHIYPEGRHSIHLQYPEDFNKRVQEFLLEP